MSQDHLYEFQLKDEKSISRGSCVGLFAQGRATAISASTTGNVSASQGLNFFGSEIGAGKKDFLQALQVHADRILTVLAEGSGVDF